MAWFDRSGLGIETAPLFRCMCLPFCSRRELVYWKGFLPRREAHFQVGAIIRRQHQSKLSCWQMPALPISFGIKSAHDPEKLAWIGPALSKELQRCVRELEFGTAPCPCLVSPVGHPQSLVLAPEINAAANRTMNDSHPLQFPLHCRIPLTRERR